jgi:hypothetical protein
MRLARVERGFSGRPGDDVTDAWQRLRRFIVHNVLHADDTPHRLALGVAIGVFVGLTPLVGLQMVIAVALAALLRANKVVCVPLVWISNPFTFVIIYPLCLKLGNGLVGSSTPAETSAVLGLLHQLTALGMSRLLELGFWSDFATVMAQVGFELWVGCLLAGFVAGTMSYFVSRQLITAYRERRLALFKARAARRAGRRMRKRVPARGPLV